MRTELINFLLDKKSKGLPMNVFQGMHELGQQKDLPRKGPQGEMFHGIEMWKKLNNIK